MLINYIYTLYGSINSCYMKTGKVRIKITNKETACGQVNRIWNSA